MSYRLQTVSYMLLSCTEQKSFETEVCSRLYFKGSGQEQKLFAARDINLCKIYSPAGQFYFMNVIFDISLII